MSALKDYDPPKKKLIPARVPEICHAMLSDIADQKDWTLSLALEVAIKELHSRVKRSANK